MSNFPTSRLKKNYSIPENPYSSKQNNLGISSMNTNPINGKDYPPPIKYLGNPYMQGIGEESYSNKGEKLRILGNNLMK